MKESPFKTHLPGKCGGGPPGPTGPGKRSPPGPGGPGNLPLPRPIGNPPRLPLPGGPALPSPDIWPDCVAVKWQYNGEHFISTILKLNVYRVA